MIIHSFFNQDLCIEWFLCAKYFLGFEDNGANKTDQVSTPYSKGDSSLNLTLTQYSCLSPALSTTKRTIPWACKGETELKCL